MGSREMLTSRANSKPLREPGMSKASSALLRLRNPEPGFTQAVGHAPGGLPAGSVRAGIAGA